MYLPKLQEIPSRTDEINVFGGINDTFYIPEGYFKDMENMSSDYYPAMGPRKSRTSLLAKNNINGMVLLNNDLYIAAGTSLYKNSYPVSGVVLSDNKKQMLAYGAYLVILPDKIIYNTEAEDGEEPIQTIDIKISATQKRNTDARTVWTMFDSYFYISDENGRAYVDCQNGGHISNCTVSDRLSSFGSPQGIGNIPFGTTPATVTAYYEKTDRDYNDDVYLMAWNSESDNVELEQYYESTSVFMPVEAYTTFFITADFASDVDEVAANMKQGDYVQLVLEDASGNELGEKDFDSAKWEIVEKLKKGVYVQSVKQADKYLMITVKGLDILNWMKKNKYIYESQITSSDETMSAVSKISPVVKFPFSTNNKIVIKKEMPDMDYITVSNNRIWGCSSAKHEIYACKLGEPTSWYCYTGLASDSYTVTIGSDGPFTGAFTYKGTPYFFKENLIICMYGTKPSNYQVDEIYNLGVEEGSSNSLAILDGYLYYKARNGVVRFDGSSVSLISEELGNKSFSDAVAAADDRKYYISMKNGDESVMYVYDVVRKLWHREDNLYPNDYITVKGTVFALRDRRVTYINSGTYEIKHDFSLGTYLFITTSLEAPSVSFLPDDEGTLYQRNRYGIEWYAETGFFERYTIEHKYIQKLGMRCEIAENALLEVSVMYDNDERWTTIFSHCGGKKEGTRNITFRPRRCEKFRLRFSGKGQAYVYAVQLTVNEGSDKRYGNV